MTCSNEIKNFYGFEQQSFYQAYLLKIVLPNWWLVFSLFWPFCFLKHKHLILLKIKIYAITFIVVVLFLLTIILTFVIILPIWDSYKERWERKKNISHLVHTSNVCTTKTRTENLNKVKDQRTWGQYLLPPRVN